MGGPAKKATKKFEKNHLKGVLERRKEFAKVKQRHRLKDKKRARREADANVEEDAPKAKEQPSDAFAEMDVDDFFAGDFKLPDGEKESKSKKRKRVHDEGKEKEDSRKASDDGRSAADGHDAEASDDDVGAHVGQLESLKEKDPEFYNYLKQNDAELLDFGDLAEVDNLSETEEPTQKKKKKTKANDKEDEKEDGDMVTKAIVKKWQQLMAEQHSLRAMRQTVLAFRSAVFANEEQQQRKYVISDPDVYHQVLMTALEFIPRVLNHHLPTKESHGKVRIQLDSPKFKTLTPLIKSHTSALHHLLANLSDAGTLKLTLNAIEPLLPYILPFRKLLRVMLKTMAGIWSDVSAADATRINAFLAIRRLMVIGDAGIRTTVLKTTYEGVVRGSRNTSTYTLAGINLMKNSAAEIWGIDQAVSYTTGFNFIRQLALHLRSSIVHPSKESYKTVYNWQYVHSLDFWSRVLATHCDALAEAQAGAASPLRPLIYPVTQITLGAMRLIPTAQYFPLRFQLVRALLRLSHATGTYIPLTAPLLEVLQSAELRRVPKPSTVRPLDFAAAVRAPRGYLRTRVYQDGAGDQTVELLGEFFVLWAKHIAFPELSLPVVVALKRWLRAVSARMTGNRNGRLNHGVLILVHKLEANARWIEAKRADVSFSPRDRTGVDGFLKDVEWEVTPLGAFIKVARKQRADRAKILETSKEERKKDKEEEEEDDGQEGGAFEASEDENENGEVSGDATEDASEDDEE